MLDHVQHSNQCAWERSGNIVTFKYPMYCNFSVLSDSCLRLALEMQHLNSFQYTQAQNNLWYFAMLAFTCITEISRVEHIRKQVGGEVGWRIQVIQRENNNTIIIKLTSRGSASLPSHQSFSRSPILSMPAVQHSRQPVISHMEIIPGYLLLLHHCVTIDTQYMNVCIISSNELLRLDSLAKSLILLYSPDTNNNIVTLVPLTYIILVIQTT